MRKVSVKNLRIFSDRKNSITYISDDNKWIIKFSGEELSATKEEYEKQIKNTRLIQSFGISTPDVGEIIIDEEGKLALEYEYIADKKSFSRAVSENIEKLDEYMLRLSNIAKKVHSVKINDKLRKNDLFDIESLIINTINNRKNIYTEERVEKIKDLMSTIEKTDTLLHLDFQPGNYIISHDKDYMIDLNTICYGNPIYDIALFYFLYHHLSKIDIEFLSHNTCEVADKMWRTFVKYYYHFTTEKEIDDFEAYISPISFLSMMAGDNFVHRDSIQDYINEQFENVMMKG